MDFLDDGPGLSAFRFMFRAERMEDEYGEMNVREMLQSRIGIPP
jgi:hypothetical protein